MGARATTDAPDASGSLDAALVAPDIDVQARTIAEVLRFADVDQPACPIGDCLTVNSLGMRITRWRSAPVCSMILLIS